MRATLQTKIWHLSRAGITKLPHPRGVLQFIKSTRVYNLLRPPEQNEGSTAQSKAAVTLKLCVLDNFLNINVTFIFNSCDDAIFKKEEWCQASTRALKFMKINYQSSTKAYPWVRLG